MIHYWADVHADYARSRFLEEAAFARLLRLARQARREALVPGCELAAPRQRLDRRLATWAGIRLVRLGELLLALGAAPSAVAAPEPAW